MAILFLIPLMFLPDFTIAASEVELDSIACRNDVVFSKMNEKLVNKDFFCRVLRCRLVNGFTLDNLRGIEDCHLITKLGYSRKFLKMNFDSERNDHQEDEAEQKNSRSLLTAQNYIVSAGGALCLCCILICPCFYKKKKEYSKDVLARDSSMDFDFHPEVASAVEIVPSSPLRIPASPSRCSASPQLIRVRSVNLSMSQAAKAARNFSPSLQIGEGGSGTVYKGFLDDGQIVAIKRAKKEEFDHLVTEFKSEAELLAKIDHKNLVKLLGYVDEGNERLIITEYVPNGTLREHLDGMRGGILDFNQRLEISIDVAHGLTYLHIYSEKQIIHRDVKSSNILLSATMRAKVADFGFARMESMDGDRSHISTKVKGTLGYLDPEYYKTLQLNAKSDVYSFGILLMEILTGRRPVETKRPSEERVTLKWVFGKYRDGQVRSLMDPLMEEIVPLEIIDKMFALALECAAPVRSTRPDMKTVGERLWGIRKDYMATPSNRSD